jgi:hypothetical protein
MNDIDSVLSKLKKLYDVVKADEIERSVVAGSLSMAEKGGGFANLISDMEKYGFIETGGGKVIITDMGKLALFGTPAEIDHAKANAVSNIDLFRDLFQLYGVSPSVEQIKAFLRQKAFVDVVEAQKLAPKIDIIYKKLSKYITTAESPEIAPTPISEVSGVGIGRGETMIPEPKTQPLKVQFGDVYIQVPADANSLESIKLAIDTLEFMRQRLQKEQKKDKTE